MDINKTGQNPFLQCAQTKKISGARTLTTTGRKNTLERSVDKDTFVLSSSQKKSKRQALIEKAWGYIKNVVGTETDSKKAEMTESQDVSTPKKIELVNVLSNILRNKVDSVQLDFSLSPEAVKKGTDLLAPEGTREHEIIEKLVKECYVNVKHPDQIKALLLKQYVSLPHTDGTTVILNPSDPNKESMGIGTSNKYISQWCAEALDLPETSIFDVNRINELQELINSSSGRSLTIMVPDDFSGSGRSITMNTINYLRQLDIPDDVQLDIVFAPATATTTSKKIFKYFSEGNLKGIERSKILSDGSKNPDLPVLTEFFANKGNNIRFVSSPEIYTVPTIYETNVYKGLTDDERQAVEILLTCDASTRTPGETSISNLTGYGRNNLGINCTMASFPSNDIDETTGEYQRKSPNNNLFGAMPYAIADGVSPDRIKMPGASVKEDSWRRTKLRVIKKFNQGIE